MLILTLKLVISKKAFYSCKLIFNTVIGYYQIWKTIFNAVCQSAFLLFIWIKKIYSYFIQDLVPLGTDSSRHTTLGLLNKAKHFIRVNSPTLPHRKRNNQRECKGKMKGGIGWNPSILGVDRNPWEFYLMFLSREIGIKLCQMYSKT